MTKKRRRKWWIGGGFVVIGVAIGIITLTGGDDERIIPDIELAIAQVVEEYGFELDRSEDGIDFYSRPPLAPDEASKVASLLRTSCPSWDVERSSSDQLYSFIRSTGYGGQVIWIMLEPDDNGDEPDYDEPVAFLFVTTLDNLTILQSIRTLLPILYFGVPISGIALYWALIWTGRLTRSRDDGLDKFMQVIQKRHVIVKLGMMLLFGVGISIIVLTVILLFPALIY